MDLKRGVEKATQAIISELKNVSTEVKGKEQIAQVGTITAKDKEIGDLIADVMEKVGKDGVITVEESKGLKFETEYVEGMQFDRGYISAYFITNAEKMVTDLSEPYVLLHEKKISNMKDLVPILEQIAKMGKPLLIVAEDIEGEALATLVVNRLRGTLQCAAVKAPGFGDRRKSMLEDIAILTGGRVISEDLGLKLENISLNDLGTAKTFYAWCQINLVDSRSNFDRDNAVAIEVYKVDGNRTTCETWTRSSKGVYAALCSGTRSKTTSSARRWI